MSNKNNKQLHSGKWTPDEEAYTEALIEEFEAGRLDIQDGTTLRSYLAGMLDCKPKRISKKFEGKGYNGNQLFWRSDTVSPEEERASRGKLQRLKAKFQECVNAIEIVKASRNPNFSYETFVAEDAPPPTKKESKSNTNEEDAAFPPVSAPASASATAAFPPSSPFLSHHPQLQKQGMLHGIQATPAPASFSTAPSTFASEFLLRQQLARESTTNSSHNPTSFSWAVGASDGKATSGTGNSFGTIFAAAAKTAPPPRQHTDAMFHHFASATTAGNNTAPAPISPSSQNRLLEHNALETARLAVAREALMRGGAGTTAMGGSLQRSGFLDSFIGNGASATATSPSFEEALLRIRRQAAAGSSATTDALFLSENFRKRQALEEELELLQQQQQQQQSGNAKRQRFSY